MAEENKYPLPGTDYARDMVDAVRGEPSVGGAAGVAIRRAIGLPIAAAADVGAGLAREFAPVGREGMNFARGLVTGDTAPSRDRAVPMPTPSFTTGNGASGGAPAPAMQTNTPPAQPVGVTYKDYASVNPESQYDKDIEFTHTLSRMLGMAGLGDKAAGARDLYMKLNASRITDVGTQAQRAFVAGDVTKGIDMFNHMIPNGEKIVGYAKKPDGTYSFKMQNGTTVDRSPQQLAGQLAEMTDPALIGRTMFERAKIGATAGKEVALAQLKHAMSMEEAVLKGAMSREQAMSLAEFNRTHGKGTTHVTMTGEVFIDKPDGSTVKMVEAPSKLAPNIKVWTEVPMTAPAPMPRSAAAPASQGTMIDAARFAAALGR